MSATLLPDMSITGSLTITPIPCLADNYAWLLRDTASGATALVDPGEAGPCARAVEQTGGRLDLILLTHHHADHIAGVPELAARYHCAVIGAAADRHRLPRLERGVREGDVVALGASKAQVLETPGHTLGHVVYYFSAGNALMTGDTLFSLGCGRLLEGTAAQMFTSLRKIAALPPETRLCCGHEYTQANARFALSVDPDNPALRARAEQAQALRAAGKPTLPCLLRDEMKTNPFLRAPDIATLADLRSGKDNFS